MKKTTLLALMLTLVMSVLAQKPVPAPKWAGKAQKAIFSLVTYDKSGEMLHSGTGFYVGENGEAVADLSLFRDAYSAVAIGMKGEKQKVDLILGADDTYSIVRFKVDAKKNAFLAPVKSKDSASGLPLAKGEKVYALPFSKEKIGACPMATVEDTAAVQGVYGYYTLSADMGEKAVGAPLFNESGGLVGIVQPSLKGKGYALDTNFKNELTVKAIASSSATMAMNSIHIRRGIPDTPEEGLVYLYFNSRTAGNDEYLDMVNQFVTAYPENAEGYFRRATPLTDLQRFDEAGADLKKYLELAEDKARAFSNVADAIYNKLIYQPEPKYDNWSFDVAAEYVDKALEITPELDYRLQKARILMAKGDYTGALSIYDEVNKNTEERTPATFYAASVAHEHIGDSVTVQVALLDSAIALFGTPRPKEAANYVMRRAQLLEQMGRYREAVAGYNEFCYLNNNKVTPAFYSERARIEINARMYQQAVDDINLAIDGAPREPLYYIEKSALMLRLNQIDDCISAAKQCIALAPESPDAYRILGYAQIQKGDKDEGRKNLERAVELGDEAAKEVMDKYLK